MDTNEICVSSKIEENDVKPPYRVFDFSKGRFCRNNMEIDATICAQTIPDPICYCYAKWSENFSFRVNSTNGEYYMLAQVRPIACYLEYRGVQSVAGTTSVEYSKTKGFTSGHKFSAEMKASASAGISFCEVELEITTNYEYTTEIKEEETIKFSQTLSSGSYFKYQGSMVYAFKLVDYVNSPYSDPSLKIEELNGIKIWVSKRPNETDAYIFIAVHRDDPFTKIYSSDLYSTVSFDQACLYLMTAGYLTWD